MGITLSWLLIKPRGVYGRFFCIQYQVYIMNIGKIINHSLCLRDIYSLLLFDGLCKLQFEALRIQF